MTNDLMVKENMYCVTNIYTGHIFNFVCDKLEGGEKGSEYPYFQKLGQKDGRICWDQMKELSDDILEISYELYSVPYPVATYFKGDLELRYKPADYLGRATFFSTKDGYTGNCGIDDEGLFRERIQGLEVIDRVYFKEVRKENPEFENFMFDVYPKNIGNPDRIVHQHKGATLIWKETLDKFQKYASDASLKVRNLVVVG